MVMFSMIKKTFQKLYGISYAIRNRVSTWYWRNTFNHFGKDSKIAGDLYVINPNRIWIGDNVEIGNDVILNAGGESNENILISIGNDTQISNMVSINSCHLDKYNRKIHHADPVIIMDNVWLATGVIVNPDVVIGNNSIIGAGAVVTHDIKPNSLALGIPAEVQ
jgi:acetyltransferase-like isoleucine patch superfamily enzyme